MILKRLLFGLLCSVLVHAGEKDEFVELFDGKSLEGWDGDPVYWSVKDGVIVGEVTPETLLKRNSFLIWRGGTVGDFELVVEYRVSAKGNSGINYRSVETPDLKWSLTGYQADIDGRDKWTGQNYEERGRKFLAYRGQSVVLKPDKKPELAKEIGSRDALQKSVKKEDWNTYRLVVRGTVMKHFVNGVLMSEVEDLDPENRVMEGLLGVQVHVGPPMKIEYRRISLKKIKASPVVD
ncbi:MAG: DUF1080 domain-containing protein [Akkermansiaceae bacterium]